jgi:hypothetical protein
MEFAREIAMNLATIWRAVTIDSPADQGAAQQRT